MITLIGTYFDGVHPLAQTATLDVSPREAVLRFGDGEERGEQALSTRELKVSPSVGSAPRFVSLPGGRQFSCANHRILDLLPQSSASEGPVHWLEQRWAVALAGVGVIVGALALAQLKGIPALADHLARTVPLETEKSLGARTLETLDEFVFEPSQLVEESRKNIGMDFQELIRGIAGSEHYRLEFRMAEAVGPNAFAFPGGIIVVTDELVWLSQSNDEVAAVIAHEIGHQVLRHNLKGMMESSAVAVLAAAVSSDASMVGGAITELPFFLLNMGYSREHESEADEFGFGLLKRTGRSPLAFRSIMRRMGEKYGDKRLRTSFLASHPAVIERAERALKETIDGIGSLQVSTHSMAPLIRKGAKVKLTPIAEKKQPLRYGDIVAIDAGDRIELRRILAVGGDRIEVDRTRVTVNGTALVHGDASDQVCDRVKSEVYGRTPSSTDPDLQCHTERAGSSVYTVLMDTAYVVSLGPVTVPEGHYLAVGDHRGSMIWRFDPSQDKTDVLPESRILGVLSR